MGPVVAVFDAAAAVSGADRNFTLTIRFDLKGDGTFGEVLTMSPGQETPLGSGLLTLDDRGGTATIHATGTLDDGSTTTVYVECPSVTNL